MFAKVKESNKSRFDSYSVKTQYRDHFLHVGWTEAKQRHIFLVTMRNDESFELRERTCSEGKKNYLLSF